MPRRVVKLLLAACVFILVFSCKESEVPATSVKTVLVSKMYEDRRFVDLFNYFDSTIVLKGMYSLPIDSVRHYLSISSGVVISGGNDIQPALYGKSNEIDRCGKLDERRDSLEILMINYALDNKIPLLGICRGEQILNVSQGGTLIIDVPSDWKDTSVSHRSDEGYVEHRAKACENTLLANICGSLSSEVKSLHHQAVENIAPGFRISAYSLDSLPEAIELVDTNLHPFVLGVQWHPEKMDYKNPLSGPIVKRFIKEVYARN